MVCKACGFGLATATARFAEGSGLVGVVLNFRGEVAHRLWVLGCRALRDVEPSS